MPERLCSREDDCNLRDLGTVHRPDEREWLCGVRTRNRLGREPVGVLPALLKSFT
jgi:hypothetical protein